MGLDRYTHVRLVTRHLFQLGLRQSTKGNAWKLINRNYNLSFRYLKLVQYSIIPTETIFLRGSRPKNGSQLLRVSREYQLTAPGIIRVQEIRYRDDALGFCGVPCFVYENVREMTAGKLRRHKPEKKKL